MKRLDKGERMDRRSFLKVGVLASSSLLVVPSAHAHARTVPIVELEKIEPWKPVSFNYPSADEPAILIDVGRAVKHGVGPKKSIIAFSALCQHMGCVVNFDEKDRLLKCPCHASWFDPLKGGKAVEGPSPMGLPVIALKVKGGKVYATGIIEGLVYGRASND
jgi:arsenite oxidase small subunit